MLGQIDDALENTVNSVTQIYTKDSYVNDDERYDAVGNFTFFASNPHYIGGIAGINLSGRIENTYNKVIVSNLVPYQSMKASYGLSPFKFKLKKKRTQEYTQNDIDKLKEEYEKGRNQK